MSEKDQGRQQALVQWIEESGGVAGSLHAVDGSELILLASHRLPEQVVAVTRSIAKGKGMAGLAWSRKEPVQTCNLKEDRSGDVRPGAKAVSAQGAVALPLLDDKGEVIAVAGLAFADERELSPEELTELSAQALVLL